MFIEISELNTVAAEYKVEEITDYDSSIAQQCILAAVKRVRRLLSGRYDCDAILSTTGEERDAELVENCKNISLWFLIRRCNVDIHYNRVKYTYVRDMAYLRELKEGSIPSDLPLRETDGQPVSMLRAGSDRKISLSW